MRQFYFPSGHLRPLPWPQQDPQQQQSQKQLISYDSDGGWVRGASTAVLVYLHRVATGVTVVDNNGTSVVTALGMALVVAIAAVTAATTVIVGSILVVATTATTLLPVVVIHRQIG